MRSLASRAASDEEGAATVEWTLVAALLTLLFLSVLQIGFAMHVRTVLVDAAAEGARAAGLHGATADDGARRTAELIALALADDYADDVRVHRGERIVEVSVRAPLPLIGLVGFPDGIEVRAHAPVE